MRQRVMTFVVEVVEDVDEGDEFPMTTSEIRGRNLRDLILSTIAEEKPVSKRCNVSGIFVKGDIWS